MKNYRLAMVGFGNVGQAFARLMLRKTPLLEKEYSFSFKITGIATGSHGSVIDPAGIDLEKALAEARNGFNSHLFRSDNTSTLDFIRDCPADALLENSPVNPHTGEPAAEHLRAALRKGMHAVTANKGPVVFAQRELSQLAAQQGKRFLFESSVLDGAPIFSLFRETLPAVELRGFSGILNSCTNFILGLMEQGVSFEEAVQKAQSIGIAETDPSADLDGWDAAVKVAALCNVLMGADLVPSDIPRVGIRGLAPEEIRAARSQGERWKLICRASLESGSLVTSIRPEKVNSSSPFFAVEGTSSLVKFESDVLPGLGILEMNPGPETTAYGLLADLIRIFKEN
jgi:homoserine dehydrogenase